jgi:hypothetical protein
MASLEEGDVGVSARVDRRDVLERLADVVEAADFELTHPDEPFEECACGATLLRWDGYSAVFVCAGCGLTPTYWLDRIHPAPVGRLISGDWERGVPPEVSAAATLPARKDADAPDESGAAGSGCGVLGRLGYALRSLRLGVNWGAVWAVAVIVAFWTTLGYCVGVGL